MASESHDGEVWRSIARLADCRSRPDALPPAAFSHLQHAPSQSEPAQLPLSSFRFVPPQPKAFPDMPANPSLQPEDRTAVFGQLVVPPPAAHILPPAVPQLVTGSALAASPLRFALRGSVETLGTCVPRPSLLRSWWHSLASLFRTVPSANTSCPSDSTSRRTPCPPQTCEDWLQVRLKAKIEGRIALFLCDFTPVDYEGYSRELLKGISYRGLIVDSQCSPATGFLKGRGVQPRRPGAAAGILGERPMCPYNSWRFAYPKFDWR